jgi:hypothetical protein
VRADPKVTEPTDAILCPSATCAPARSVVLPWACPVRRYLPELFDLVWTGAITPGKVFGLTLSLGQVAAGCRAMDERHAINTLHMP